MPELELAMSAWWSKERIEATVNPEFISRKLPSKNRALLHRPLAFGKGLTDGTYLDWILARGPRLLLILDDIGCPEHIFTVVDKSYDDTDLPLSDETISDLSLPAPSLEKKFARRQNAYNVQELWEGSHVEFGDDAVVPVETVAKTKGSITSNKVDRVCVRNKIYARRCMAIGEDTGIERVHLVLHFKILQKLKHPHLVSVWATYIHEDVGYLLLQPYLESTLKMFIEDPPKSFKQKPRAEQCETLLQWVRCLIGALAFLHQNGYSHQAIRPSNILIDSGNNIFLGAYQALGALEDQEPAYEKDTYEHAAPEQWQRKPTLAETNPLRATLQGGGRTGRRVKDESRSSASPNSPRSPKSPWTMSDEAASVAATANSTFSNRAPGSRSGSGSASGSSGRSSRLRTHSIKQQLNLPSSSSDPSSQSTNSCRPSHTIISTLTYRNPEPSRDLWDQSPYFQCDVFSLSVTIIEILSLLASVAHNSSKLSPAALRSHLGRHNRTAGRGGAPADSSFHANLRQTNLWLDQLSQADAVPSNKLAAVFRKAGGGGGGGDKGKAPQHDGDGWRCKGALGNLGDLLRPNVAKEPRQRYTSGETLRRVDGIYERWGIGRARCCAGLGSRSASEAGSIITALRVPGSASSNSLRSKASSRAAAAATATRLRTPSDPAASRSRSRGPPSHPATMLLSATPSVRSLASSAGLEPDRQSVLTYELEDLDEDPGSGEGGAADDDDDDDNDDDDVSPVSDKSDESDAESSVIPLDDLAFPSPHSSRPSTAQYRRRPSLASFHHATTSSAVLPPRSPPPAARLPALPALPADPGHPWPFRRPSAPDASSSSSSARTAASAASSAAASAGSSAAPSRAPSAGPRPATNGGGGGGGGGEEVLFRPAWREVRFAAVGAAGTAASARRGGSGSGRRRGPSGAEAPGRCKGSREGGVPVVPQLPARAPSRALDPGRPAERPPRRGSVTGQAVVEMYETVQCR